MDPAMAMPKASPMASQSARPPSTPIPMLKGVDGVVPEASISVTAAAPAPKKTRMKVPTASATNRFPGDTVIVSPDNHIIFLE